jgi:hypothetical protein
VYLRFQLPDRLRPAGSVASYSNHGFALAGLVMERAARQRLADLAEEHVFAPLGMHDSTFDPPPAREDATRHVTGYMWRDALVPVPEIFYNDWPASGAVSTAADMAALMKAMLSSEGAWRDALVPRFRQHASMPAIGAGGLVEQRRGGVSTWQHGGDWQDYFNVLVLIPSRRVGIFIAGNNGEQDRLGALVLDAALADLEIDVGTATASTIPPPQGDPGRLDAAFTGRYRSTRHEHDGIGKAGLLTGEIPEIALEQGDGIRIGGRPVRLETPTTLRRDDGELWAVRAAQGGEPALLFRERAPTTAFERVRWLQSVPVQRVLFLATLMLLVGRLAWGLRKRPILLPTAIVAVHLFFIAGLVAVLATADRWGFQYGTPILLRLWLTIPLVTLAATVLALFRTRAYATCALSFVWCALVYEWNLWVFWR